MTKSQTACFTGHRKLPPAEIPSIKAKLTKALLSAIDRGYRYFGAGGALGFDTLAAQTVLELRERYSHIRLILVLPCRWQTKGWRPQDAAEYDRIMAAADKVVYVSDDYTPGCMHKRNRHLVEYSSLCIGYLTNSTGGTAYTMRYALQSGLAIINLGEK